MRTRSALPLLVPLLMLPFLSSCGDDDTSSSGSDATTTAAQLSGTLDVFAAASLTEVFTDVIAAFKEEQPGVTVTPNFAASSALARQIQDGAPADVIATADEKSVEPLSTADLVGDTTIFAKNQMAIIVPPDNPAGITSLDDLAKTDVKVAVCAEPVPCGSLAKQVFTKAGITVTPVTQEENVKGVVTKVTTGEVDAGIVYVTDAKAAGDKARTVEIADDVNVVSSYPIAIVTATQNKDAARAWIDFVTSEDGQKLLEQRGFLAA